jgi:hypothetical protein
MKTKRVLLLSAACAVLIVTPIAYFTIKPSKAENSIRLSHLPSVVSIKVLNYFPCTSLSADSMRYASILSEANDRLDAAQKWINLGGNQHIVDSLRNLASLAEPFADSMRVIQNATPENTNNKYVICKYVFSYSIGQNEVTDTATAILNEKSVVVYRSND